MAVPNTFAGRGGALPAELDEDFSHLDGIISGLAAQIASQAAQIAAIQAQLGSNSPSLPTVGTVSLSTSTPAVNATVTITAPTLSGGSPSTVTNERYEIYVNSVLQQTVTKTGATNVFTALAGWAGLVGFVRYRADHPAGNVSKDSASFTTQAAASAPVNLTAPSITTTVFDANTTVAMSVGSWSNTPTSYDVYWTFEKSATGTISAGATSLTLASQWLGTGGAYTVTFSTGEQKTCTFTMYSTAVTWSGGLASQAAATFEVHTNATSAATTTRSITLSINKIGCKFRAYARAANGSGTSAYVASSNSPNCRDSIGVVPVEPTAVSEFNKFAAPAAQGNGSGSSYANAGLYTTMISNLVAGDRLALLGGTYTRTAQLNINSDGASGSKILIEAYPGETVVFAGSGTIPTDTRINVYGDYIIMRRIRLTTMKGDYGLLARGLNQLFEGITVDNGPNIGFLLRSDSTAPKFRACLAEDLDNNGAAGIQYSDGGWADGFQSDGGVGGTMEYCTARRISDDGFDMWAGANNTMRKCASHDNGIGGGAGQGFKVSGPTHTGDGIAENCLSWGNKNSGLTNNGGLNTKFRRCTSWDNGNKGLTIYQSATSGSGGEASNNIALANGNGNWWTDVSPTQTTNSWQLGGTPAFISTDPTNINFLRPTVGGGFEGIGAYSNLVT